MSDDAQALTTLLRRSSRGDKAAEDGLLAAVYPELHRIAEHYLARERRDHTLTPTALVHEAYLKLFGGRALEFHDRKHFFVVAARQMRRALVDHARRRGAAKNPQGRVRVTLSALHDAGPIEGEDLLDLNAALTALEAQDERAARVVELRYFGGLEERETAEVLEISLATLKRDWTYARAWLLERLARGRGPAAPTDDPSRLT